ncbi:NUZM, NADH-ubiquinone oxidoreductase 21.3 kDa subunit [Pisolithus marmoratus]|nr:NUZM, NADH-ubiquinone oxidoreductase 21.3 kDa subunit [Pisolithus marmoratus]
MTVRKAAESTLYHVHPKGFWKKFRDAVVVNPEISTGLPIAGINRYPPPGSRPEKYSTPASKASDPAQNPYWKRDVRRAYPQLSVVTQTDLATLLIQHSTANAIPAPSEATEKVDLPVRKQESMDLAQAIATITSETNVYSKTSLPPSIPTAYKKWRPELAPDAPHDPDSYFPMVLYK